MRSLPFLTVGITLLGACAAPEPESPPEPGPERATAPVAAQEIRGEEIAYQSGGVQLNGYLVYDAARQDRRPGVLVVHEWWGHNEYARRRARMLAELGYTAFAVDMYGDGKFAEHPDDAERFMTEVTDRMDVAIERFRAARAILEQHPSVDPTRIAAIGYCFGGGIVLHMARIGSDLAGVASFHGGLATASPAQPGAVTARVLVLHGADDPFVPAEQLEAFKQEMDAAGADWQLIAYPGAIHSFTNPGATAIGERFGLPLAYQREADERSWAELERFLAESFGGQPPG